MRIVKILPIVFYSIAALLIAGPLLLPGFILTIDLPPTDKIILSSITQPNFLLNAIMYLLHFVMPNYVIQKVILLLALFLSAWGMHRLIPDKDSIVKYFAGFLYMINPFTYERYIAGQWLLMLGYALLPFAVSFLLAFIKEPTVRKAVIISLLITFLATISLHMTFIYLLFALVYLLVYLSSHPWKKELFSTLGIILLVSVLLNSNWIIGLFSSNSGFLNSDVNDIYSFQTVADENFGLVFNIMSGYGFWTEAYNYFISPKGIMPLWPLIAVIFILLALLGLVVSLYKKENLTLSVTLTVLFLLSLDFAAGLGLKDIAGIIVTLYEKIPFLRIIREPQKLVSIIMFSYAYFGSLGFAYILEKVKTNKKNLFAGIFLILPIIYTLPIFWGFWGQLKPVWYPDSWKKVNQIIASDRDTFQTVFFPWHQYMRFRFNNNMIVANPAMHYFDKPIIFSQSYETASVSYDAAKFEGLHIDGLLDIQRKGVNLLGDIVDNEVQWGRDIAAIDVKYIILAKEDDWVSYRFLDKQTDLKKVYEDDDLILYQNLKWGIEEVIQTEEQESIDNLPSSL